MLFDVLETKRCVRCAIFDIICGLHQEGRGRSKVSVFVKERRFRGRTRPQDENS